MSLDIIIGPMFSGKSSRILSIVSRYSAIDTPVLVVKHELDTRYGNDEIITHDNRRIECIRVSDLDNIHKELLDEYSVIVVDEAQFFQHLVPFCEHAVDTLQKHVYLVGLDGDSNRRPFGDLLNCIPLADRVERITAFCHRCANGTPGLFSWRRTQEDNHRQVMVGGHAQYESLCRKCYISHFT
jgi:thymidine kinase